MSRWSGAPVEDHCSHCQLNELIDPSDKEYPELLAAGKQYLWDECKSKFKPFDILLFGDSGAVSDAIRSVQFLVEDENSILETNFSHVGTFWPTNI